MPFKDTMPARITIYLKEMFPLTAIIGSIVTAIAVQLAYLKLYGLKPDNYFVLIIPGIVLTAISLLIRIMDEFKDYKDDLTNFPERPLPSGRVKKSDLVSLGIFCVLLVIFLSLTSLKLLIWALVTLSFTFLMLKWFFIESIMRKSLPLAFITHHPIVLFNFTYLMIACTQYDSSVDLQKALYILPICLIFTNWEIVRKIRQPQDETGYTTYSKIWGPRPAIVIAIVLQLIFSSALIFIFEKFHSPIWLWTVFILGTLILMAPSLMFFVTLRLRRPLKEIAELQILFIVLALLVSALL